MKLRNDNDVASFLVDIGRVDLINTYSKASDIPNELFELFVKRRRSLVSKLKNFQKSQAQKANWRKNRYRYISGIKRFHKSVAGKRFHRAMGRFLVTRLFPKSRKRNESLENLRETCLKAISSLRTHLYIESDYYMSLDDEVEFSEFMDYALPKLIDVEKAIYENSQSRFSNETMELLLWMISKNDLIKTLDENLNRTTSSLFHKVFKKHEENDFTLLTCVKEMVDEYYENNYVDDNKESDIINNNPKTSVVLEDKKSSNQRKRLRKDDINNYKKKIGTK